MNRSGCFGRSLELLIVVEMFRCRRLFESSAAIDLYIDNSALTAKAFNRPTYQMSSPYFQAQVRQLPCPITNLEYALIRVLGGIVDRILCA